MSSSTLGFIRTTVTLQPPFRPIFHAQLVVFSRGGGGETVWMASLRLQQQVGTLL